MTDKTMTQVLSEIDDCAEGRSLMPMRAELKEWRDALTRHLSQPAERGEAVAFALSPSFVERVTTSDEIEPPCMGAGCVDSIKKIAEEMVSACQAERQGDAEFTHDAVDDWAHRIMCFANYTAPPPAAGVPDGLVRMTIGALDDVDTEMRATGRATNRFSQLASDWRGMLSATPSPTIDVAAGREAIDPRILAAFKAIGEWAGSNLTAAIARAIGDAK